MSRTLYFTPKGITNLSPVPAASDKGVDVTVDGVKVRLYSKNGYLTLSASGLDPVHPKLTSAACAVMEDVMITGAEQIARVQAGDYQCGSFMARVTQDDLIAEAKLVEHRIFVRARAKTAGVLTRYMRLLLAGKLTPLYAKANKEADVGPGTTIAEA